ncbi:MAG TPA: hypothetical protein VH475_13110 [Tepidisphaeraceae bacterium]|jgi:hypothetical protein
MRTFADISITDDTLFTVALIVFIVCGALYILAWVLGRWRP